MGRRKGLSCHFQAASQWKGEERKVLCGAWVRRQLCGFILQRVPEWVSMSQCVFVCVMQRQTER